MRAAVAIVVAALCSSQAIAADEFCDHLNAFIRAPFSAPVPRSAEFYWMAPGDAWGTVACFGHGDADSKKLCNWLLSGNTSHEFSEMLPEQVLGCNGFTFPVMPNVEDWKATYSFPDEPSGRWMVMDVRHGQRDLKYDVVRISVLPDGKDEATSPLPDVPPPGPIPKPYSPFSKE
jgi:hypothetical protein